MSAIDEALRANQAYAKEFHSANVYMPPRRKLIVITCMDSRLMPDQMLGFGIGDAHVIRNAGGLATDDALRSLIISHHLLGAAEVMIINHTDCGMLTFTDETLRQQLQASTGATPQSPACFLTFGDLEANVRRQVAKVRSHPWIPQSVRVRGFIYDVRKGELNEVSARAQEACA